ncbi:MAG TPA: lipid A biosynthesis lauroyl acyltransferase [Gammaproteobacteria bacterium]
MSRRSATARTEDGPRTPGGDGAARPRAERPAVSLRGLAGPRYWPTWLLLFAMRAAATLPYRWQLAAGFGFGRLLRLLMRSRARIARANLAACFPELTDRERARLLDRHFAAVGMSFVEMGIGWFTPIERLRALVRVEGREHLEQARAAGRGIILLSAHFTPLEVGFAILEDVWPGVSAMYRTQRNALMDALVRRGRSRFAAEQIPRDNVRALVKALKAGRTVAYMPDQTYLGNQSELLPFFGEPAMTNIATPKIAQIAGAVVLPYLFRRLPDDAGYLVTIMPPLPGVPSGDPVRDTLEWLAVLESHIRVAPEQYLWLYKKFKNRPAPLPDLYA